MGRKKREGGGRNEKKGGWGGGGVAAVTDDADGCLEAGRGSKVVIILQRTLVDFFQVLILTLEKHFGYF